LIHVVKYVMFTMLFCWNEIVSF